MNNQIEKLKQLALNAVDTTKDAVVSVGKKLANSNKAALAVIGALVASGVAHASGNMSDIPTFFSMYEVVSSKYLGHAFLAAMATGVLSGIAVSLEQNKDGLSTKQKDDNLGFAMGGGFMIGTISLVPYMVLAMIIAAFNIPAPSAQALVEAGISPGDVLSLLHDIKHQVGDFSSDMLNKFVEIIQNKNPLLYDQILEEVAKNSDAQKTFEAMRSATRDM